MENENTSPGSTLGVLLGAIGILLILFLLLCFRTVGAGQVGIITRFGEVNRTAQSGVALKLPWPIERLHKMDVRIQKEQQNAAAATSDLQDVSATLALNYSLDREAAIEVYKKIGPDYRDRIVSPALQESFKASSAQYTASELLTRRPEVKAGALEVIKKRLSPFGISVQDVSIVNFSFSAAFSNAIEQKQVAAQEAEKAHYLVEKAEQEAKAAIAAAKGQAESQRVIQETVTELTLQKEAIAKWSGELPKYMGNGTVFNIPLE